MFSHSLHILALEATKVGIKFSIVHLSIPFCYPFRANAPRFSAIITKCQQNLVIVIFKNRKLYIVTEFSYNGVNFVMMDFIFCVN